MPPDAGLDARLVRRRFERAAPTYEAVSVIHQEVGKRLREHLDPVRLSPRMILEVGAGTGICARELERRYPGALVVVTDPAGAMVRRARARRSRWRRRAVYARIDAGALALRSGLFDLLYSNLALHWCNDLDLALAELARVSAPGALVAFSLLGPDTFRELRECWAQVDDGQHVHPFPDMHDVGDGLVRAGFGGVVMESERLTISYPNRAAMLVETRAQGAANAARARHRGLTGRRRGIALKAALAERFPDGAVELTYEVVYAHAWKAGPGVRTVAVEELIRSRRG
jgi:malonyl-CoA O-methyltransferase